MPPHLPPSNPHWNLVATALPLAALLIATIVLRTSPTSDFATRLGSLFKATILCGGIAVFGEVAAIASLYRSERHTWLSLLAVILNASIILAAVYLIARMDWD